jgi:hypothetical protein
MRPARCSNISGIAALVMLMTPKYRASGELAGLVERYGDAYAQSLSM